MALAAKIPGLGAAFTSLTAGAGPALTSLGSSIQAFGVSAMTAAKPLFVLGAAIALIGVGIGAILFGIAEVVKSFKDLTGEQILGALGGIIITLGLIGIGLLALIPVLTTLATTAGISALPLLAVGAAIMMIGFGIGAILFGITEVIKSFKDLTGGQILGALAAIVITLGLIGYGLLALIPVLTTLATTAGLSVLPLLAVGAAIMMIGFGIKMAVDSMAGAITAAASLFTSFGSLTLDGAKAMKAFAAHIDDFSDVSVSQELITYTKNLSSLMVAAKDMTPEAAAATKLVMDSAANLATVEVSSDNAELIKAIAKLTQAMGARRKGSAGSHGSESSGGSGNLEITVDIDGRSAWKGIKPYFEKELKGL
jgi:uncharacterized membrane protein